jgi:predicted nucleic acid-binding protein
VVDVWICNSSPLIALARIQRLDLIESLAAEVVVPATVVFEIEAGASRDDAANAVRNSSRLRIRPDVAIPEAVRSWQLDPGESHVLAMALQQPGCGVDLVVLDEMQARFKEARIPVQLLTTEDRARVAIVFERINRTGVPLDTLQLLTAWTWSEEFDLQHEFGELREELEPFGFAGVREDSNLLLRCCAAVIAGDASPEALVGLKGADVRSRFGEIVNGVKGAIDFLRSNLSVETLENLPFSTVLVPLSVFFAVPGSSFASVTEKHRARLLRWFWRSCFARRYSSGVLRNLRDDIAGALALRNDSPSTLGDFPALVTRDFFLKNAFRINTVATKTFVLLLAQLRPRSFVSGNQVSLKAVLKEYNRSEFHHLYPQSFLTERAVLPRDQGLLRTSVSCRRLTTPR